MDDMIILGTDNIRITMPYEYFMCYIYMWVNKLGHPTKASTFVHNDWRLWSENYGGQFRDIVCIDIYGALTCHC